MKKLLSCILVFSLLISLSGCNKKQEEPVIVEPVVIDDELTSALIPEYVHYDDSNFNNDIEKLYTLIENNSVDEALALYDDLYTQLNYMFDLDTVSYINFCIDATNETWSAEYDHMESLIYTADDSFKSVAHELAISSFADKFKKHLNNDEMFEDFVDYEPLSDELLDLINQESALETEYISLDDTASNYLDMAGEIFVKLVKIRDKIAKAYGYENYALYADENSYARDYSEDDLKQFYQAIKDMDYSQVSDLIKIVNNYDVSYNVSGKQGLANLSNAIYGVSSDVQKALDYMKINNLYWFDNSSKNYNVGYTTVLYSDFTPFIFEHLSGSSIDLYYNVHELGHFANFYYEPLSNALFNYGSYDLSEIQSQGFEMICADNISEVLGVKGTPFEYYEVLNLITLMVDACIFDEWQRIIYANPDMTLQEIDDLYNLLNIEYGMNPYGYDYSYYWKTITHNFDSPMYYISYGTSAFSSLQLWNTSRTDFSKAVEEYEVILHANTGTVGYMQATSDAGMVMFNDYDGVVMVMKNIIDTISKNVKDFE